MRDAIRRRVERLQKVFDQVDCVCNQHKVGLVYVQNEWSDERKQQTLDTLRFDCPVHGNRLPNTPIMIRLFNFDPEL